MPQSFLPPIILSPFVCWQREKVCNAIQARVMRVNEPNVFIRIRILRFDNRLHGLGYIQPHRRLKKRLVGRSVTLLQ